ncbi:MAG TPA: GMC family oxidoreductase N-terminal domain-containing protein, partial [Candidatus Microbacterium pullistercoris]|nr:GMC family oxidoreductase N-terminal domain-containing protein [Candidatus Microbacterium pullistercoris]
MQYERGGEHFWNQLEADGNPGWGWDDMLAAFRSFENHELGASDVRGSGGPLDLHVSRPKDELNERIFAAAEAYGLPRVDDINACDGERVGYIPNTVRNGFRLTAARAFLTPALKRKNLTLELNTHVSRILFDGTRATGVRARSGGVVRDFAATTEVIVCAGALDTPLLLERSGIGDPRILHGIGVPTVVDSPNVGEHAIEQRQVAYQASVSENIGYNQRLSSPLR